MRDLIVAQLALLRAAGRLRREPVGTLTLRDVAATGPRTGDPQRAQALALAVATAARYGLGRPKCLVRALALRDLLDRHGIGGSEIRVGVRRHGGRFAAHAWVRWGDDILGDDPAHVATFSEVDDIRVVAGP